MKYADYMKQYSYLLAASSTNGTATAPPPPAPKKEKKEKRQEAAAPPKEPALEIPQDLLGVQAYLLWEQAGKPDGADFGDEARRVLEERLRGGASLADIERELRAPPAAQPKQQAAAAPAAPAAPAPPQPTVVGQSMVQRSRNPLDLIRRADGGAVAKPPAYLRTPLSALVEAAQEDKDIHWFRVGGWVGGLMPLVSRGGGLRTQRCACSAAPAAAFRAHASSTACLPPTAPVRCSLCPSSRLPWLQLFNLGNERELLATVHLDNPADPESDVTLALTTSLPRGGGVLGGGRGQATAPPQMVGGGGNLLGACGACKGEVLDATPLLLPALQLSCTGVSSSRAAAASGCAPPTTCCRPTHTWRRAAAQPRRRLRHAAVRSSPPPPPHPPQPTHPHTHHPPPQTTHTTST
jgi:hypothetical protein